MGCPETTYNVPLDELDQMANDEYTLYSFYPYVLLIFLVDLS